MLGFLGLFEVAFVLEEGFLHCVLHGFGRRSSRLQIRAAVEEVRETSESLRPFEVRNRRIERVRLIPHTLRRILKQLVKLNTTLRLLSFVLSQAEEVASARSIEDFSVAESIVFVSIY